MLCNKSRAADTKEFILAPLRANSASNCLFFFRPATALAPSDMPLSGAFPQQFGCDPDIGQASRAERRRDLAILTAGPFTSRGTCPRISEPFDTAAPYSLVVDANGHHLRNRGRLSPTLVS